MDFVRVREILDGVGFAGPYTIELEGIGGEPEPGLEIRQDRVARSVAAPAGLRLFRLNQPAAKAVACRVAATLWLNGSGWESNPPRTCLQALHWF